MEFTKEELETIKSALETDYSQSKKHFMQSMEKHQEDYWIEQMQKAYTLLIKIETHGSNINKKLQRR